MMKGKLRPKVSTIIVNWNGKHLLAACLDSLKRQTFRNFETIIVDNGSTDGSVELLRAKYPWARVIRNKENLGFAQANNIGIAASKGEYVALLNNDVVADRRWLGELVACADACPQSVGSFGSRMMLFKTPNIVNSTGIIFFKNGGATDRDFKKKMGNGCDLSEDIAGASAGAALYRRNALEAACEPGGQYFSSRYFMYLEDVDLAYRLQWAGFGCRYVHSATVLHHHRASSKKTPSLSIWLGCLNRQRNILRNFTWKMILSNLHWMAITELIEFAYVFWACSPLAPFRAKWQILREFQTHRAWHKELARRHGKNERRVSMLMETPDLAGAVARKIRAFAHGKA
ncbi:MAG: glycosyltransferase family 2 protein [Candidatus Micrarchaeia archaeon]